MAAIATDPKQDRRISWVLALSAVVVVMIALGTPAVISTANNTGAVARSQDISACRSVFNTDLNEARTIRSETAREEERARNLLVRLQVEATEVAIFESDLPRLLELREQLALSRDHLTVTEAEADAAVMEERRQNDIYADLSQLSLDSPDEFLRRCEEQKG